MEKQRSRVVKKKYPLSSQCVPPGEEEADDGNSDDRIPS
jgi:hypothetical protein